jgi:hypothetical protein
LPRPDARLNRIAGRQLDNIGVSSGLRYVADRADIFRSSKALLEELEFDEPDIHDVLAVAEFLAGDTTQ